MADPATSPQSATPPAGESPGAAPKALAAIRIPRELELSAASRLVSEAAGPRSQAARRMVTAAAMHGIDLSLMWGTVDRAPDGRPVRVRQVCLAVPGSGKTAAMVISGPSSDRVAHQERVAALNAACEALQNPAAAGARVVRLAQALPEPDEQWAVKAYLDAGFTKVGDLVYMRRPLPGPPEEAPAVWPAGVQVRPLTSMETDHAAVIEALDRSYQQTLDCPELCGLRETADVLDSHRATGVFDPRLWWIAFQDGQPRGCILLSRSPENRSVELVYLGLSPELRGLGVGSGMLRTGLSRLAGLPEADHIACAVDLRNTPALRVYERFGFSEFGRRVALVRPI